MKLVRRLIAWWRPTPKTPEELDALRAQHQANFDQESRRISNIPMMEGEAERRRRR